MQSSFWMPSSSEAGSLVCASPTLWSVSAMAHDVFTWVLGNDLKQVLCQLSQPASPRKFLKFLSFLLRDGGGTVFPLCSLGYPETPSVDQAGPGLRNLLASS